MSERSALALVASFLLGAAMPSAAQLVSPTHIPFDPSSTVESRIIDPVTDEARRKFSAALDVLTPVQQTVLRERLRLISFATDIPANAMTMRVDPSDSEVRFNLIINTRVLGETLSEFATRKENQLFETSGSQISVSVVAGSMDALGFLLAHEATHMVDMVMGLSAPTAPDVAIPEGDQTPFVRGVWETPITPASSYRGEVLDSIPWRPGGKRLAIENARTLYEDLERTPFASVYASMAAVEDIAELVAWRQMTEEYRQPYRIEVRDGAEVVYSYEPMRSPLVRSRLSLLAGFDSPEK